MTAILDFGAQLPVRSGTLTIGDIAGNPNVNPAVVSNYEVDYDRSLPELNSTLRTAFYYQQTRDVIAGVILGTGWSFYVARCVARPGTR